MNPAPPWGTSLQAEQALLGALLLDNTTLERVGALVSSSDFYTEHHADMFRVIAAMVRRGQSADIVTVSDVLRCENAERFEAEGGASYLAQLVQTAPSVSNAQRYAELVRSKALCRRLDALGLDTSRRARESQGHQLGQLLADVRGQFTRFAENAGIYRGLQVVSAADFIGLELPELQVLLSPWLFQKNLAMVHAKRGVGKTHFALGLSFAVATGTSFLGWRAPIPRTVLYIDGEMPAQLMQRRLRELASAYGEVPSSLRIVTPDQQEQPMPDLATIAGQAEIDDLVTDDTALIVIDNLSALVRSGGAENESESWGAVSEWALKHRRAGRTILFVNQVRKASRKR